MKRPALSYVPVDRTQVNTVCETAAGSMRQSCPQNLLLSDIETAACRRRSFRLPKHKLQHPPCHVHGEQPHANSHACVSTGARTRIGAVLGVVDVLDPQAEQRVRQPRLLRRIAGAPQGFNVSKTLWLCLPNSSIMRHSRLASTFMFSSEYLLILCSTNQAGLFGSIFMYSRHAHAHR